MISPKHIATATHTASRAFVSVFLILIAGCSKSTSPADAALEDTFNEAATLDNRLPTDGGADLAPDGEADAQTDQTTEECEPGETRTAPCPRCGTGPQVCGDDGRWLPVSECFDQRTCEAGEVEEEELAMCATRRRLCLDSCEWSEWNDGQPAGECEVGEVRNVGGLCSPSEASVQACSDRCEWSEPSECGPGCAGERRTEPPDAEEICIPAGTYLRGSVHPDAVHPRGRVFVSAFYIDRYPVTARRAAECIAAGDCMASPDFAPEQILWGWGKRSAWAFCRWDGRRLPTSSEWEKAARGPDVDSREFLWSVPPTCDELSYFGCPGHGAAEALRFDGAPVTRSVYGVERMMGGVREPVADTEPSITFEDDPLAFEALEYSNSFYRGLDLVRSVSIDEFRITRQFGGGQTGARCVRSAPGSERPWEAELIRTVERELR